MKMDNVVFNRSLCDSGYQVDFVIGTTYSLDFDTFMSLPFSLGFMGEPEEEMLQSPPHLFAALRMCSERLAVFCNFADMQIRPQSRKVYCALMETSVFPVMPRTTRANPIVNFHPKIWVVKETKEDDSADSRVKLIVMSRNLTRDGSLDCICVLNGKIGTGEASQEAQRKHLPLCEFLDYLKRFVARTENRKEISAKRRKISELINDIKRIEAFDIEGSDYDDYAFFPMGIGGYSGRGVREEISTAREVAIVSPFLDDRTLALFSNARSKMLLTREESLSREAVEPFGRDNIWTMNPDMLHNNLGESVDLHAKMYFTTAANSSDHYLYLGSTNATQGGFDRNVEFLLKLHFRPYKITFDDFCSFFKRDSENRFVNWNGSLEGSPREPSEYERTRDLRKAVESIQQAVFQRENDKWAIIINVLATPERSVRIHPLVRPDLEKPLKGPETTFRGLALAQLTEFFVIKLDGLERVVKIQAEGQDWDWKTRDDELCVKMGTECRDCFMDCISFFLSESKSVYMANWKRRGNDSLISNESTTESARFSAVYEDLLRIAYESPESFQRIRSFVEGLPENIVPQEFFTLCEMVGKAGIWRNGKWMPATR
ncbi:MAG: hypothetical protein ILM98_08145 [Kiritimatiellae bacterium]|nr:hypothetical protein [Kiritimatiellia bacterium]